MKRLYLWLVLVLWPVYCSTADGTPVTLYAQQMKAPTPTQATQFCVDNGLLPMRTITPYPLPHHFRWNQPGHGRR